MAFRLHISLCHKIFNLKHGQFFMQMVSIDIINKRSHGQHNIVAIRMKHTSQHSPIVPNPDKTLYWAHWFFQNSNSGLWLAFAPVHIVFCPTCIRSLTKTNVNHLHPPHIMTSIFQAHLLKLERNEVRPKLRGCSIHRKLLPNITLPHVKFLQLRQTSKSFGNVFQRLTLWRIEFNREGTLPKPPTKTCYIISNMSAFHILPACVLKLNIDKSRVPPTLWGYSIRREILP